ncbi:MAG: toll/interleukin-1 receptor domain-containing protein [Saprospiraceae bacterium]|nr:toll/interleukin-1 receptor domain-containing protein [Saprospiraceae bacterium]
MKDKIKIFMSYAHEDEAIKSELDKHLAPLKRMNIIDVWQDQKILAGDVWDDNIAQEIMSSDIILFLVSADFNNSEYIWNIEIQKAMERHAKNEARVIPIILSDCLWMDLPYAILQALPKHGKPISNFKDVDTACLEVVNGIYQVVKYLLNQTN